MNGLNSPFDFQGFSPTSEADFFLKSVEDDESSDEETDAYSLISEKLLVNSDKLSRKFFVERVSQDETDTISGVYLSKKPAFQNGQTIYSDFSSTENKIQEFSLEKIEESIKNLKNFQFSERINRKNVLFLHLCLKAFYHLTADLLALQNVEYPALYEGQVILKDGESPFKFWKFQVDVFFPNLSGIILSFQDARIGEGSSKSVEYAYRLYPPKEYARARILQHRYYNELDREKLNIFIENESGHLKLFNEKREKGVIKVRQIVHYRAAESDFIYPVRLMKLYKEGALSCVLKKIRRQEWKILDQAKKDFACHLAQNVNWLRKNEIIFRDLKPGNYLVRKLTFDANTTITKIRIALTDFEFAGDRVMKIPDFLGGTYPYWDPTSYPRHFNNFEVKDSPMRDLWGAACIIWEIFMQKKVPWYNKFQRNFSYEIEKSEIWHYRLKMSNVDNPLGKFFEQSFRLNPEERMTFEHTLEFLKDLNASNENLSEMVEELASEFKLRW